MTVCTSVATVYADADYLSNQVDELLFGETAEVLAEKSNFYKIRSEYGYMGWVNKKCLFGSFSKPNYMVTVPFADMLPCGKYGLTPYCWLPYGARVAAKSSESLNRFLYATHPIEHSFYIHSAQLSPLNIPQKTKTEQRQSICRTAKKYLGVQYRWGGRTHLGIDCSGLCFNAYKFNGITLWRDADIEKNTKLKKIHPGTVKSGDLLFFKNHVALYLGKGKIIHATADKGCVAIENLKESPYINRLICGATAF